jgi:hypothetical protein
MGKELSYNLKIDVFTDEMTILQDLILSGWRIKNSFYSDNGDNYITLIKII